MASSLNTKQRIHFKSSLFWDVDFKNIDIEKHKRFIIERILEFGGPKDYEWAVSYYGKRDIKQSLLQSRKLDKKSRRFWCFIFNINEKQCVRNQSIKKQNAFWKR